MKIVNLKKGSIHFHFREKLYSGFIIMIYNNEKVHIRPPEASWCTWVNDARLQEHVRGPGCTASAYTFRFQVVVNGKKAPKKCATVPFVTLSQQN